ncbi:50S ribosomal protein L10 [Chloroflexota bacterium]
MGREEKTKVVDQLEESMSQGKISIMADYRGLTTSQTDKIRAKLRDNGITFRVVKNSLAQLAVKKLGREDMANLFEGPVAVATGYEDEVIPARVLVDIIRAEKLEMAVKGGFMADRKLSAADVKTLATLPAKEVLIAKVIGGIQAPIYGLVNVTAGPIRNILGVLQARRKQLEEG